MPSNSFLAIFAFSFVISIGAVISPGPVSAAIIGESPRKGWLVGPAVASGHSLLELIFTILILFGLNNILSGDLARSIIAVLGGIVLILLGLSYFVGVRRGTIQLPQEDDQVQPHSLSSLVGLGIVTTISNPFWYT